MNRIARFLKHSRYEHPWKDRGREYRRGWGTDFLGPLLWGIVFVLNLLVEHDELFLTAEI